jgi:hypothetical protein
MGSKLIMGKNALTAADLAKMPLHVQQAIAAQLDAQSVQQNVNTYARRIHTKSSGVRRTHVQHTKEELLELEKQRLAALFSTNEYGWKTPAADVTWMVIKQAEKSAGKKGAGYYVFMACTFLTLGFLALMMSSHHQASFHGGLFK